ncbi:hypothetical protein U1Q18_001665 [Sarracenia purpurea var. burkii]
MAHSTLFLALTFLSSILFLPAPQTYAQSPATLVPSSPAGLIIIFAILVKGGQYTTFLRLLTSTKVADQIDNQLNNYKQGMTVFAPTDTTFNNLPAGTLNNLTTQQHVQLVLYHVLPEFYSLSDLQTVSNPVRTQATGQDGGVFGLFFSGENSQVNVSTGVVETQVNNALRQEAPLAVYEVDKVLVPKEFSEAKAPAPPPSATGTPSSSNHTTSTAASPGSDSGRLRVGLGLVAGFGLFCMCLIS